MKNTSFKIITSISAVLIVFLSFGLAANAQNSSMPDYGDIYSSVAPQAQGTGPDVNKQQNPSAAGADVNKQQNPNAGGADKNVQGGSKMSTFYLQNPLDEKFNSVGGLIKGALEIFSYIVVLFAVLALIYVGLQFVLAQGNPSRMNELKMWLMWIVVGVAIVIGARIIVSVVINTLEVTNTVSPGVISGARNGLQSVSPTP